MTVLLNTKTIVKIYVTLFSLDNAIHVKGARTGIPSYFPNCWEISAIVQKRKKTMTSLHLSKAGWTGRTLLLSSAEGNTDQECHIRWK
jgi:hypothetical protein